MVSGTFVYWFDSKLWWSIGRTNCLHHSTRRDMYSHHIPFLGCTGGWYQFMPWLLRLFIILQTGIEQINTPWWRHQMETLSALPVTGEFPAQRSVTRSFDVFFDLRLNKSWVNNREAGDLRRYRAHYDVTVMSKKLCLKHLLPHSCYRKTYYLRISSISNQFIRQTNYKSY